MPSGGHFLPQLRAATPIIACNASRVSCFPPSVKGKFFRVWAPSAGAQKKNCWEKWAVGGTFPTRENHPLERKRKPAKRERIPTTSLRTGLGMTGLAYERIFSSPIKSVPFCVNPFSTVEWRPFRRKEKIVLAFCRRGIYNSIKSIKGQSVRRLVRRRWNRVRSPASWSL